MANLCCCEVKFYGNEEGLKKLYEVGTIKDISRLHDIIEELGIKKTEYDGRYEAYNFVYDNKNEIVSFDADFAWNINEDFLDLIAEYLNLKYAVLAATDEGYYALNDDERKYFPNYVLDAEDSPIGDFKEFKTEEETLKYLEEKTGQRKTIEEWITYFYDSEEYEDHCARLWVIDRD